MGGDKGPAPAGRAARHTHARPRRNNDSAHGARRGHPDGGADAHVLRREPVRARGAIRIAARGGFYLDSEVASAVEGGDNFVPEPVSVREREVLLLAARGLSGKEIAAKLFISERTVQTHLASIYDKLGAKNKTEAMLLAIKYGIVTIEELID